MRPIWADIEQPEGWSHISCLCFDIKYVNSLFHVSHLPVNISWQMLMAHWQNAKDWPCLLYWMIGDAVIIRLLICFIKYHCTNTLLRRYFILLEWSTSVLTFSQLTGTSGGVDKCSKVLHRGHSEVSCRGVLQRCQGPTSKEKLYGQLTHIFDLWD